MSAVAGYFPGLPPTPAPHGAGAPVPRRDQVKQISPVHAALAPRERVTVSGQRLPPRCSFLAGGRP